MPAVSSHGMERREMRQTVGQSGMTPTAFAFLIPVFVVVIFCPFLCVFCIRKRQRALPPVRKPVRKPALRRAEARERLKQVTDVSDVTDAPGKEHNTAEVREHAVGDSSSVSERECAICLSTLYAPAPPEPALLSSQPVVDEAATRPSSPSANTEPEAILKLRACGHVFHSECLVSWFVLRKTSCPICRAAYISKEDMQIYEDEEAAISIAAEPPPEVVAQPQGRMDANGARISNWRYFWRGENVWNRNRTGNTNGNGNTATGDGTTPGEAQELARWTHLRYGRR